MKNIILSFLVMLLAQNYIEVDGQRTYVRSMTDKEIMESEQKDKLKIKSVPAPPIEYRMPRDEQESPPAMQPFIIRLEQSPPAGYSDTIKIRIKNKKPVDKEFYESTGRGTFRRVEVDKGVTIKESWKMDKGSLVKERQ
jgi:hypothetical protein